MDYLQVNITCKPALQELLSSLLFAQEATGIEETEQGLTAFFQEEAPISSFLETLKKEFNISYTTSIQEEQNWNTLWESNYSPIEVGDYCYIYANFHEIKPGFKHNILIHPKMAFGTGHHQTTRLMLQWMESLDFTNKSVLDLGCGTGILGLVAAEEGASQVHAVDYDKNCMDSLMENIKANSIKNVTAILGSIPQVPVQPYHYILANINRNFLLENLSFLQNLTSNNTKALLSGFYEKDIPLFQEALKKIGWKISGEKKEKDWVAVLVEKT